MSLSNEELALRKVEIGIFATLLHVTGSPEKANDLIAQAQNYLYPKKGSAISSETTAQILSGLNQG
jgi:hypothetical protein